MANILPYAPVIALIIGIVSIIVVILINSINKQEVRIDKVVDTYCEKYHNDEIPGLKISGICMLKDEKEIQEVITKIEIRIGKNPLGEHRDKFKNKKIKVFFDYISKIKLGYKPIKDIIEEAYKN